MILLLFISLFSQIFSVEENQLNLIDKVSFSPGGYDFCVRYLYQHRPLFIKDHCQHWPIVKGQWHNLSHVNKIFNNERLPILDENGNIDKEERYFGKIVEFKYRVNTDIPKESKLLQGIYLPLILQCHELKKGIQAVHLRMNDLFDEKIHYNTYDIIIIPFAKPINVDLFNNNNLDENTVNTFDRSMMEKLMHESVVLKPGDMLYIPAYTWHHISSEDKLDVVTIKLNLFQNQISKSATYSQAVVEYKRLLLLQQNKSINCSNTKTTIKEALTIDFTDEQSILHLRIPKRNERPEDVTLASGYKMPVLGLGTALLNESTYNAVKYALSIGYRMFDTAYGYPHSEVQISKAIHDNSTTVKRDDIFITTKLHPRFLGYKETLHAIDESLERLQTGYIDLYLIHSVACDDFLLTCEEGEPHGNWQQSWRAMEEAKRLGKIRSLGVSNFHGDMIYELLNWSEEPVSVIQNWFDPFNQDSETRKICQEYNIRYMGFSTLGTQWKMMGLSYNPVMESDMITAIAGHYDYVISHVVLRWAIHMNVTVIPRSANENHIAQNLRALDISLHQSDIDSINELNDWMNELENMDFEDFGLDENDVSINEDNTDSEVFNDKDINSGIINDRDDSNDQDKEVPSQQIDVKDEL